MRKFTFNWLTSEQRAQLVGITGKQRGQLISSFEILA
jgi:hypothetical protein